MNTTAARVAGFVVASLIGLAPAAQAQDRQIKQQQNVLQIGEITIVGRVQKPIAAVDVAKIQPKLTLA